MMPAKGWKTVTVSDQVYDYFWERWSENRKKIVLKHGVSSFSGYLTRILYDTMRRDEAQSRFAPLIDIIDLFEDRVVLRDARKDRIAEVFVRNGQLYCNLCESSECVHTGYSLAIPEVVEGMKKKGYRVSKGKN